MVSLLTGPSPDNVDYLMNNAVGKLNQINLMEVLSNYLSRNRLLSCYSITRWLKYNFQSVQQNTMLPFLDAIASVGLHMSVCLSVHVLTMEFLTDEHSVRSTLDGISLCNNTILVSVAHWLTDVSFSLAN